MLGSRRRFRSHHNFGQPISWNCTGDLGIRHSGSDTRKLAATSSLPATSSSGLNPWVTLPTEQFAWAAATVENVRSAPLIQKTQPAATRPVRPSGSGSGMGSSKVGTDSGTSAVKLIANGSGPGPKTETTRSLSNFQSVLIRASSAKSLSAESQTFTRTEIFHSPMGTHGP